MTIPEGSFPTDTLIVANDVNAIYNARHKLWVWAEDFRRHLHECGETRKTHSHIDSIVMEDGNVSLTAVISVHRGRKFP